MDHDIFIIAKPVSLNIDTVFSESALNYPWTKLRLPVKIVSKGESGKMSQGK